MDLKKKIGRFSVGVFLLLVLDQATKYLAVIKLKGKNPVNIWKSVLQLKYLENSSAAFGIDPVMLFQKVFQLEYFKQNTDVYMNVRFMFLVIITILLSVLLILFYFKRVPDEKKFIFIKYIILFIVSGAIGNLIDRILHHYVIDFIYFELIDFPIFNVADIYITLATGLLLLLGIFYYKEEDLERLFPPRRNKKNTKDGETAK